jgi:hypothetical protein
MGFFDRVGDFFEEREEREEWRERREEYLEEREEFLEEEEWELEGGMYDPYRHGEMFFDPSLGHHGVMYNGVWHPLEFSNGSWIFVHPRRYNVPRRYQPRNLMPPQQPGFATGFGQPPAQGGYGQPQGGYGQPQGMGQMPGFNRPAPAPQAASLTCPRCQAVQPAGTSFCSSCGNDLRASAASASAGAHCTACGAVLAAGARFCAACGRSQV